MIHRLPISENLRQHVKSIISLMLNILQIDNEENVLVCLRIIIELHKNFRPSFNNEVGLYGQLPYYYFIFTYLPPSQQVQQFLALVKKIYTELPNHMNKIFEPTQQIKIKDLKELNMEQLLSETYVIKTIHLENPTDPVTFQMVNSIILSHQTFV